MHAKCDASLFGKRRGPTIPLFSSFALFKESLKLKALQVDSLMDWVWDPHERAARFSALTTSYGTRIDRAIYDIARAVVPIDAHVLMASVRVKEEPVMVPPSTT